MTDDAGPTGSALDRLDLTPTRAAGLERLAAFVPRAGRWYANHGGVDHGPDRRANAAALQPWLASRLVTPEEAIAAVEAEHGAAGAAAFRAEVEAPLRRRDWLRARPGAWRAHRLRVEQLFRAMAKSPSLLGAYEEAVAGRTGLDAADGWARELADTGWLHPAALRAFASLWIFSLRLPWELGADLHHQLAVDGEAAGHVLWREVAGLEGGHPPYVVTVEEISRVSGGRFHPKRRLVEEHARALTEAPRPKADHAVAAAPEGDEQPEPGLRVGWLITEASLDGTPPDAAPAALAGIGSGPHRPPFGAGERLAAWLDGALADGLARAATASGLAPNRLDDADWSASLAAWVRAEALQRVWTAPPTPGLIAERLTAAQVRLARDGVRLNWPTR